MPSIGELLNSKYNKAFKAQTLSGSNTTVATALFRVTGTVMVTQLYGVVTTALGSNITAVYYRLNDQTAQQDITLATGSTMSSFVVGSTVSRRQLAATAASVKNANVGQVNETATAGASFLSPFTVTKKSTANTDIEFVYTTTQTPTTGALIHYVEWQPLSDGATLVAL